MTLQWGKVGSTEIVLLITNQQTGKSLRNKFRAEVWQPDYWSLALTVIGGLGGRRLRPGEFDAIFARLERPSGRAGAMAQPMLLFTPEECREVGRFYAIAREGDRHDET